MLTETTGRMSAVDELLLTREIEEFLYREADMIDSRHFEEWLDYFAEDIRYWVPIRKNLQFKHRFDDATDEHESAWIDDTRATLQARVYQVMTKIHWAEEPLSRVSHIVANIYVDGVEETPDGQVITVRSKLICHRSRMEEAGEMLVAKRIDKIRRTDAGLKIFWRKILIDQATLHVKNLSFFL
ncbi:3-phenylpropionate/cinnamic acid dioxygenase subunit beta [Sphingomonas naphthae]|uniref:3-phenylpropionate/cinnamic acid dioxygenase subunit beta n=1 Tax=Sphingomonas naphthae TaxID=1813468 RepID=A0ABY7TRU7_9SPHN|nr:3-phenylpropionate/cinnamic acid dioxygenase subunit beta [Sphingomonas naphthae]WCT75130.1 3-phenylpropionate/cinnamic acid dioxygenase subunit beta [Sphingomonas naphthae]